jgi:hypothetical protein
MTPTGEKMACQTCLGKSAGDDSTSGCRGCGGFGYIADQMRCDCGRKGWFRPGVHSSYEGKTYYSLDALGVVCRTGRPIQCVFCDKKEFDCVSPDRED